MRTIEEIQTELNALEASPSYYGNEWKKPRRERLKGELFDAITHGIPLDRLTEICNAERDGRLVVLPCMVGDTVYARTGYYSNHITETRALYVRFDGMNFKVTCDGIGDRVFGKTVFLTRAEAEAALQKEAQHE